jgi:hypothetical protein
VLATAELREPDIECARKEAWVGWLIAVKDFLANPIVTSAAFAIGILGTVLTYLSWRSNRRTDKIYAELFRVAEKNIDKTITEESLSQKRKEIQLASEEIRQLQERIRSDIPLQARRAVLMDRINSSTEHLQQNMESIRAAQQQLAKLGSPADIPPELLHAVEVEVSPEYLLKARRATLMTYLSAVLALAAITPVLALGEFERPVAWTLLGIALGIVLFIVRFTYRFSRAQVAKVALVTLGVPLGLFGFGLAFASVIFIVFALFHRSTTSKGDWIGGFIVLAFGLVAGGAAVAMLRFAKVSLLAKWTRKQGARNPEQQTPTDLPKAGT